MASTAKVCVALIYVSVLSVCQGFVVAPNWTLETLKSLEKAVEFFDRNSEVINLDGLFGLRVAEGQVIQAVWYIENHRAPDNILTLLPKLQALKQRIHVVADKCLPSLEQHDGNYFRLFQDTIDKPFLPPYSARRVNPTNLQDHLIGNYSEVHGDACFGMLLGVPSPIDERLVPKCTINDHCFQMMTSPGQKEYAITHQLLFFIEASTIHCDDMISTIFGPGGYDQFQRRVCNQIYTEAKLEAEGRSVAPWTQDLFLEQCMVCSLVGFEDFLSPRWLRLLIDWQRPDGCYDNSIPNDFAYKGRRLLYERLLPDGCLSHKSGLGTGLLGVYIRYLVEHGGHF